MRKFPVQVIVCLRKILRSLSCNFSFRTPWRILSGKARSQEFRQKLWTYHWLCITPQGTNLYHSLSQKGGFSFELSINTDSFAFITTKKQCRWFGTLMYILQYLMIKHAISISCCLKLALLALLYYQAMKNARSRLSTHSKNWNGLVELFLGDLKLCFQNVKTITWCQIHNRPCARRQVNR